MSMKDLGLFQPLKLHKKYKINLIAYYENDISVILLLYLYMYITYSVVLNTRCPHRLQKPEV